LSGAKRGQIEIRDLDDDDDFGGGAEGAAAAAAGAEQASKRARLELQQGHMANGGAPQQQQQQQQQQQVAPWESEEHRMAVDSGTPLQVGRGARVQRRGTHVQYAHSCSVLTATGCGVV
jgi:hypothetical protein